MKQQINRSQQQVKDIHQLHTRIKQLEKRELELKKQLRINESLYSKVLDALPINIFLEDQEGHTIFANEQACKSNGMVLEELIGKTIFDFFPEEIAKQNRCDDLEVWKQRKLITKQGVAGFQGKEYHMFTGKTIIHLNESNEDFLLGFGLDITDRVRAEELLRESEENFRSLVEQAADSFFLIDTENALINVNATACELLQHSKAELLMMNATDIFSSLPNKIKSLNKSFQENSSANFEDFMISKDNTKIPIDINIRLIKVREKQMYLALCRDIRDKKKAEAQIEHMAYHDALTDLPNRWFIQSFLQHYLTRKHTSKEILGILLLDLDHFKVINDSLGHQAGDLLLQAVANRLNEVVFDGETILARFGGDEFILLVPGLNYEGEILGISEKIMQAMEEPFYIFGQKFNISASIGISLFQTDGDDMNTLIKNADLAMYHSKEKGRSCYSLYNPIMKKFAMERMDMEILLREAIESKEFILHYQPKLDVKSGIVSGMEALIRWRNKDDSITYPNSFIQIAEETGLIVQIGEWVLLEACKQCKAWHDSGYNHLSVSINISPKQFQKQNLEELIASILMETGLPPSALELELTEGVVMKNPEEAAITLKSLKALGIKISIDDFGTGFSSLSYLKYFPIDTLKIDKSFIMNLQKDEASATIASAVISLAHSLNLTVVAEGVETKEQYNFLVSGKCDFIQGYYISEPVDVKNSLNFLRETVHM